MIQKNESVVENGKAAAQAHILICLERSHRITRTHEPYNCASGRQYTRRNGRKRFGFLPFSNS